MQVQTELLINLCEFVSGHFNQAFLHSNALIFNSAYPCPGDVVVVCLY